MTDWQLEVRAGRNFESLLAATPGAALEVANHGYVLETGAIALDGPAAELAGDPRVIDTYLGAARKAA